MNLAPGTEYLLQIFIILSGVLLIPLVVSLIVVIFKLAFLVHSASDFLAFASSELTPILRELRSTADHVESISQKAALRVQDINNSIESARPTVEKSIQKTKSFTKAVFTGVLRSFGKN
jgi:hypothetical protein